MLSELTDERTHCYAVDGAIIDNMHLQIEDIPVDLNNKSTIIFLSIGGNNILSHYKSQNKDISTDKLNDLFSDYKKTVLIIQNKMNKSKIVLLDIYYPYNSIYKHYYQTITEWNNMIYSFAKDPKNNILGVLKISTLLTNDKDFSFGIEPSSIGGNKIVVNILKYY
jgi:hypothetical protein